MQFLNRYNQHQPIELPIQDVSVPTEIEFNAQDEESGIENLTCQLNDNNIECENASNNNNDV